MKHRKLPAAMLLTVALSSVGRLLLAQATNKESETHGKDLYVTIGYKPWLTSWQTSLSTFPPTEGANIQTITSNLTLAQIPAASVQYKNFFVTGGYFFSQTYTFPDFTDVADVGGTPYHTTNKTRATRKEIDGSVGFFFHPSVGLTAGYKRVEQNYHTELTAPGLNGDTANATTTYKGPTVGVAVRAGIGAGFGLYENFAYGFMKTEGAATSPYMSSEFGLTYTLQPVSLLLAFKYQVIDTKLNDPAFAGQKGSDVTKGPILGALLRF